MSSDIEVKDVVLLLVGLAGGFFTNQFFFNKQAKTSEEFEGNIYHLLERNYEQSLRNGIKDSRIVEALRLAEKRVEPISDLVEIKAKMDEIIEKLGKLKNPADLPSDLVFEYKALGDRWSQLASAQLDLKIMSVNGHIEIDRFKAAHKNIFPSEYPWSGEFRKEKVYIVDTIGTVARIVDLTEIQTKLQTVAPEKVESNLKQLFEYWNSRNPRLPRESSIVKIAEISQFHHELEMIHPFLDGNGRIGRILLEEQIAYLFGAPIKFRPDRTEYYRALRALDFGSKEPLERLIKTELERFNIIL